MTDSFRNLRNAGYAESTVAWVNEFKKEIIPGWREVWTGNPIRSAAPGSVNRVAGVYEHGASQAPTGNDGAYGKAGGTLDIQNNRQAVSGHQGILAATGHDKLFWSTDGGNNWTEEVPDEYIVNDPTADLDKGVYAVPFETMVNGPDISGLKGHSPGKTYGILHVKLNPAYGRMIYHAYYGQRGWDISEQHRNYMRSQG